MTRAFNCRCTPEQLTLVGCDCGAEDRERDRATGQGVRFPRYDCYELVRDYTKLLEARAKARTGPRPYAGGGSPYYMATVAGELDAALHKLASTFPEVRAWMRERIAEGQP